MEAGNLFRPQYIYCTYHKVDETCFVNACCTLDLHSRTDRVHGPNAVDNRNIRHLESNLSVDTKATLLRRTYLVEVLILPVSETEYTILKLAQPRSFLFMTLLLITDSRPQ